MKKIFIIFTMSIMAFLPLTLLAGTLGSNTVILRPSSPGGEHIETGILPADAPDVWYDSDLGAIIIYGWGVVPSYDVQVEDSAGVIVADETVSGYVYEYVMLPSTMASGTATVTIDSPWGNSYEGQFYVY